MNISFTKYSGAGNDFVIIDNRKKEYNLSMEHIKHLCDRHYGIGADGLMFLERSALADVKMVYYNNDGQESTMCGNGGRCIGAFARKIGFKENPLTIEAIDGIHESKFLTDETVTLSMNDVRQIIKHENGYLLDTGSPHLVLWVHDITHYNVAENGKMMRDTFPEGVNVNFCEIKDDVLTIRTYERGVEGETLSCGTGITAAAIASTGDKTGSFDIAVKALGGDLSVSFTKTNHDLAEKVLLTGPAFEIFTGCIAI